MRVQLNRPFEYITPREQDEVVEVSRKVAERWLAMDPPLARIPDPEPEVPEEEAGELDDEIEEGGYFEDAEELPEAPGDDSAHGA